MLSKGMNETGTNVCSCLCKRGGAWKRSYDGKNHADVDGSIKVEHIYLAATDYGLGTCWVCAFDPEKASKILDLPEDL